MRASIAALVATMRWCILYRVSAGLLTFFVITGLSACTIPTRETAPTPQRTTTVYQIEESQVESASLEPGVPSPTTPAASPSAAPVQGVRDLEINDILAQYGGSVGVVIVDANGADSAGTLLSDVSWSTIKVPIALAAERNGTAGADVVSAAIRSSDNAAAQSLWDSLGEGASGKVAAEIAQLAPAPTVQNQVLRPGFSAFGQTHWSLADQAAFGFKLQCHDLAAAVTSDMGSISAGHSYGIGVLPGAHFKGGWGPDPQGQYLARQFGYVSGPQGTVGVALAAKAGDGSYASDQAMLTALAQRVGEVITARNMGSSPCF